AALERAIAGPDRSAAEAQIATLQNVVTPTPQYRQSYAALELADGKVADPLERFLRLPSPSPSPAPPDTSLSFAVEPLPPSPPAPAAGAPLCSRGRPPGRGRRTGGGGGMLLSPLGGPGGERSRSMRPRPPCWRPPARSRRTERC